eukprot:12373120-Alexandrium_andersonii.AAC.1
MNWLENTDCAQDFWIETETDWARVRVIPRRKYYWCDACGTDVQCFTELRGVRSHAQVLAGHNGPRGSAACL